jgi:putative PIN family toxin of toxin-antitoxin system
VIVAVLDTNVLASGILGIARWQSTPGELLRRWQQDIYQIVVSEPILTELVRTLANPYFKSRLTPSDVETALATLHERGLRQSITVRVSGIASHSQDDAIVATALSAVAPYLVTGDKQLLARRGYGGTEFVSPRQFLALLES